MNLADDSWLLEPKSLPVLSSKCLNSSYVSYCLLVSSGIVIAIKYTDLQMPNSSYVSCLQEFLLVSSGIVIAIKFVDKNVRWGILLFIYSLMWTNTADTVYNKK